jgi:hypothetical protein
MILTPLAWLAIAALLVSLLPFLMFFKNLQAYLPPPEVKDGLPEVGVSVLIPARDEEGAIGGAIQTALASGAGISDLEVVVLDDHSTDRTVSIVREWSLRDPRVRLAQAPDLPAGWCGKQHACWVLANRAKHDLLLWVDADVRLEPGSVGRLAGFLNRSGAALVSGVPRQITGTLVEQLLIPLIHFVLLGFLPFDRMRKSVSPAYASGCGQLFLARRDAYFAAGGHEAIKSTLHDGIHLPKAFRRAGFATDLCDATPLARCRMYHGAAQTWKGLAKNATEGLASNGMIVPATLLLGLGQVAPWVVMVVAWMREGNGSLAFALGWLGTFPGLLVRLAGVRRFGQPVLGALLHPVGVFLLLVIQWQARVMAWLGIRFAWRGRRYTQT